MRASHHLYSSLIFSASTFAITRSPLLASVNFLSGVLIDIDHIPEYLLRFGFKKHVSDFFKEQMHLISRKSVVFLHGFDIMTLIFAIIFFAGPRSLAWAFYIGAMQHLLLDSIYNPVKSPWTYFLFFRIYHNFNTDKVFYRVDSKKWWKDKKENFFT